MSEHRSTHEPHPQDGGAGWLPPTPPTTQPHQQQPYPVHPGYPALPPPAFTAGPELPPPGGPGGHRARRGLLKSRLAQATAVAAMAALLGGVTGGVLASDRDGGSTTANSTLVRPVAANANGSANVSAIAAALSPAVVQITVQTGNGTATGTGVILTADGQILTNYHVISGAVNGGRATVTFHDGRTAPATVTGTDKSLDTAVITASGVSGLTTAVLGDSDAMAIGDPVVAIGNPEGLTGTVTSGIISAKNRSVSVQVDESTTSGNGGFGFPNLPGLRGSANSTSGGDTATYQALQTDAALNPGNSGGPLINAAGQVIGLNSAMYSASGSGSTGGTEAGSVGLGFAIPINSVKQVLPQMQAGKNL